MKHTFLFLKLDNIVLNVPSAIYKVVFLPPLNQWGLLTFYLNFVYKHFAYLIWSIKLCSMLSYYVALLFQDYIQQIILKL